MDRPISQKDKEKILQNIQDAFWLSDIVYEWAKRTLTNVVEELMKLPGINVSFPSYPQPEDDRYRYICRQSYFEWGAFQQTLYFVMFKLWFEKEKKSIIPTNIGFTYGKVKFNQLEKGRPEPQYLFKFWEDLYMGAREDKRKDKIDAQVEQLKEKSIIAFIENYHATVGEVLKDMKEWIEKNK